LALFSYLFCEFAVFYYEGAFVSTVKAFPHGRAIEDRTNEVCGAAFWTKLHPTQDLFLLSGSVDGFLKVPLLLPKTVKLTELELFSLLSA